MAFVSPPLDFIIALCQEAEADADATHTCEGCGTTYIDTEYEFSDLGRECGHRIAPDEWESDGWFCRPCLDEGEARAYEADLRAEGLL